MLLQQSPVEPRALEGAASPRVRLAIEKALDQGETHYTDRPGILPLREAVAAELKRRFALDTHADDTVIITCALTEARLVATQQMLQPGDSMAVPVFNELLYGPAVLRRVKLTTSIEAATRALYLTSSTPEAELRSHIAAAPANAILIYEVDDEENRFHPAHVTGCASRTLTIGTLGPATWRVGYLASDRKFSSGLRDFKQSLTICTGSLSQWAVLAALGEK